MKVLGLIVLVSTIFMVGAIFDEGNMSQFNCTKPFEIISRDMNNLASYIRCRFYIPRRETCPKEQILSLRAKRCVYPSRLVKLCDPKYKFYPPMPNSVLGRNKGYSGG
ncbi:uncharacterized protein LOC124137057 [Haliotis rufescens]|uniref:uncharacterized protein LOC124137057 n=1 Tax=Haliotis rufescens TaxID=6454 RepID=UPI001EAFB7B6|nr:uncharacterized protein LOC124137057 [Haliotis rufescens]